MMKDPVLVPLDGSALAEQALPYAETVAGSKCQLILLEVGNDEEDDEFLLQQRHGDSCAYLQTVYGEPAEQILAVAQELGAGLIVMTTRGRGALGRTALGSVADAVTRESPIPVMLIHPSGDENQVARPQLKRLVVPLDGSQLAEQALPTAVMLAKQLQIPVHLITIVGRADSIARRFEAAAVDAVLTPEDTDEQVAEAEAKLSQRAEQLRREGVACTWEVRRGSPYFSIADAVVPGDVIVITSRGRSGIKRWLLGSIAEKLVRDGPVPVIVVPARAPGAISQPSETAAEGSQLISA
jgi:nucleotide-binding universal stress UspA family protein